MISLSCVAYLTRYYVRHLVTVFLFECEILSLLPLAYKFAGAVSGTSWTCCCPPSWTVVVILLSTCISFSGSLGFSEVMSSHSSANLHSKLGLPRVWRKQASFTAYYTKVYQNILQLTLSSFRFLWESLYFEEEGRLLTLYVL